MHQSTTPSRIERMNAGSIAEYRVPAGLYASVIQKIKDESRRTARRAFFVSLGATFFSFMILVTASVWLYRDFVQSGVSQLLSLIVSDTSVITRSWQDFTTLLMETMPFLSVVVCLTAVLAFFGSLQFTLKKYTYGHATFFSVKNI